MKRVLITGTSSGFGRAMVTAFLARGHHVFATMRMAERASELLRDELARYADRLTILELDVTSERDRLAAVRATQGSLDALVNNAGYALFGPLEDTSEAQLRAQLETNFMGAALLSRAFLPALRGSAGALINVSSVFGFSGFPLTSAYCASKHALEGLSEALYHELKPHGVRVHLVEPGGHRTGFSAAVAWAEGASPVYAKQTSAYRALKAKLERRKGRPPEAVAARVLSLVERPTRRLRVVVGPDAVATAALKRLPDVLSCGANAALFSRLLPSESP